METVIYTFRHAARALVRQPGLSLAAIVTLALGIGANVAIFSVVHSVLLRPLPFADADRLVLLYEKNPERGWTRAQVAGANYVDWQREVGSFVDVGAYDDWLDEVALIHDGEPTAVNAQRVTGNLFSVLGAQPIMGRAFEDDATWRRGDADELVVLLSHHLWAERFGSDPAVVGSKIDLDGELHRVVGVMPPGFRQPIEGVDLWVPVAWSPVVMEQVWFRRAHGLRAIARLAPGVDEARASAELATVAARLEERYPETNTEMGAGLMPLREYLLGETRRPLLTLLVAVALVLLVSTANVANLLLVRAASRVGDSATRLALGAGRVRMIVQGISESLLLAVAGGALGGLLGLWVVRVLVDLRPDVLPRLDGVGLNATAFLFALAVSLVTAVLCGLLPAWRASAASSHPELRPRRFSMTRALVAAEIGLTLPLAMGAALMGQSLLQLYSVDPGFEPGETLVASLRLPQSRYDSAQKVSAFYAQVLESVKSAPGVESVALSSRLPFGNQRWSSDFTAEGWPDRRYGVGVRHDEISPGLFQLMGVPVLAGRDFEPNESQAVVIVNQALVDEYFADRDPIGVRVTFDREPSASSFWRTIVGVVGNVRRETLALEEEPSFYAPILQDTTGGTHLLVRTSGDPWVALTGVEEAVRRVDSAMPLSGVTTLSDQLDLASARERFLLVLLGAFAGIAVALATLGTFSVVAYATLQRLREIGIRIALGADRRKVIGSVLRLGLFPVCCGAVVGLLVSAGTGGLLGSQLYEVNPFDPLVYVAMAAAAVGVGLLACMVPAVWAARVEAVDVLRQQ